MEPAERAQFQLRDYADAIEYYEQSLAAACDLNDPQAIGGALADLGVVHAQEGEHDQAVALFRRSPGFRPEGIDKAKTLWNMSLSLDQLGQRRNAIARAEEALPILVESNSPDATMVQEQLAEWRKTGGA